MQMLKYFIQKLRTTRPWQCAEKKSKIFPTRKANWRSRRQSHRSAFDGAIYITSTSKVRLRSRFALVPYSTPYSSRNVLTYHFHTSFKRMPYGYHQNSGIWSGIMLWWAERKKPAAHTCGWQTFTYSYIDVNWNQAKIQKSNKSNIIYGACTRIQSE